MLAVIARFHPRPFSGFLDQDRILLVFARFGTFQGVRKLWCDCARDLEPALVRANPDRADFIARNMSTAADQRHQPTRLCILTAAYAHFEPDHILETGAVTFGLGLFACFGCVGEQLFRLRHLRAVRLHKCCGDVLCRKPLHQFSCDRTVIIFIFSRCSQLFHQPRVIFLADRLRGRRIHPLRFDLCTAQHALHALAAIIRHDDCSGAFFACPACPARAVLKRFGIARCLDMDHQAKRRQIEAACGNVCCYANAGAAVAHGL